MMKSSPMTAGVILGAMLVLAADFHMAAAQGAAYHPPTRPVWAGVYTSAQAERGRQVYTQFCSRCHRDDLRGSEASPPLNGTAFFDHWHDRTLFDLLATVQSSMPHDYTTFIHADAAADLVSFLLKENGIPAGDKELAANIDALTDVLITRSPSPTK